MEQYDSEEIGKEIANAMELLDKDNKMDFHTKELLHIMDKDYKEKWEEPYAEEIFIENVEDFRKVIDQAGQEEWKTDKYKALVY